MHRTLVVCGRPLARYLSRPSRWMTLALVGSAWACAGVQPGSRQGEREAPVRLAHAEGYVQVEDSVRLFYRSLGDGPDTVVVVHGGPGFHMNYLVADLAPLAAHHTLIFFDQRNAGRSTLLADTARSNARLLVSDLETLRQRFGLARLTLLGHSWGGLLAGLYAAEHPDRVARLMLVGAMAPSAAAMRAFTPMARLDSVANVVRLANLKAHRAAPVDSTKACWDYYALWARGYFPTPVHARRMWGDMCNVPPAAMLNPTSGYPVKSLGSWDIAPRLARVRVPVLVVHGDEDPMPRAAADAWVAALPDARLFWMPGAGHSPFVDQPAAFFTAVEGFLDGAWPDAAALAATGVAVVKEGDRARSPYLAARAVVADVENELVRGVGRADWDGVARIYAEDATVFAPGAPPIVGRQAISSYWRTLAKKGMRTLELQPMELEGAGVQMNVVGKYVMRDARDAILDLGKFLAVYRYANGRWQLTRDVLNSSLETRSPLEIPDYLGAARR